MDAHRSHRSHRSGNDQIRSIVPIVPIVPASLEADRRSRLIRERPPPPRVHARGEPNGNDAIGARLERLRSDVENLTSPNGMLDQINALVTQPTKRIEAKRAKHKTSGSTIPWHSEAADVMLTVHSGTREVESTMRARAGLTQKNRGGSENNTRESLKAIANLAYGADHDTIRYAARTIAAWVTAILQIPDIDQNEKWVPLPKCPGYPPPCCPYCRTFSLRMAKRAREIRCINPQCRDNEGRRPKARMEIGQYSGREYVLFADGTEIT